MNTESKKRWNFMNVLCQN